VNNESFSSDHCDDDDESKNYVRSLLQLETVTSVLVICSDKQFSFRSRRMSDGSCVAVLEENSRWTVLPWRSCEDRIGVSLWLWMWIWLARNHLLDL